MLTKNGGFRFVTTFLVSVCFLVVFWGGVRGALLRFKAVLLSKEPMFFFSEFHTFPWKSMKRPLK